MANVNYVASVFGIAAFGTNTAVGQDETIQVIVHAHRRIANMVKRVS